MPDGEIARLGGVKLLPGMPVEAFIQTGERTVDLLPRQAALGSADEGLAGALALLKAAGPARYAGSRHVKEGKQAR